MFGWLLSLFQKEYKVEVTLLKMAGNTHTNRIHVIISKKKWVKPPYAPSPRKMWVRSEEKYVCKNGRPNDQWFDLQDTIATVTALGNKYHCKPLVRSVELKKHKPTPAPPSIRDTFEEVQVATGRWTSTKGGYPLPPDPVAPPVEVVKEIPVYLYKGTLREAEEMFYYIASTRYPNNHEWRGIPVVRSERSRYGVTILNKEDYAKVRPGCRFYVIDVENQCIVHPQAAAGRNLVHLEMTPHIKPHNVQDLGYYDATKDY